MRQVLIELHPRQTSAQQTRQRRLAGLDRFAPQVIAVKLEQIEGNQNDVLVVAAMPQLRKAGHPMLVAAHRLAIDQAASHLQLAHRFDNERVAGPPVMPVLGQ
jgi:hypothetical protein